MDDCIDTDKNATIAHVQYLNDKARYAAYAEAARIERERRERAERQAAEYAGYQEEGSDEVR